MTHTHIAIGSNMGFPVRNVEKAILELQQFGTLEVQSSFYRTKPWGITAQPDFINAVVRLDVQCTPAELMQSLLQIENRMGRVRSTKWGPRTIDLDILTFGALAINEPGLAIPHPEMMSRAFVLMPLAEIDASYVPALWALPINEIKTVTLLDRKANNKEHKPDLV